MTCIRRPSSMNYVSKLQVTSLVFQKVDLWVCSVDCIIESHIVVFEVMKKQPGKNYKCLQDYVKAEDGDVIYKTTEHNKSPGAHRGVDDEHSIEHYKETFDLKFDQIFNNTQMYLHDCFLTLHLFWVNIFVFKEFDLDCWLMITPSLLDAKKLKV